MGKAQVPEVSIIVASYNNGQFLDRCIRSLLSQVTEFSYEVIVVDDASEDSSIEILEHFGGMIRVLRNEVNRGLPGSLNRAIRESFGRYVVRVDSDDFVSRNFVQVLTLALTNNESLDAVACDYVEQTQTDDTTIQRLISCEDKPIACGVMFRREQLFDVGLYDSEFLVNEDKELRLRFDRKYRVTRLPIPLYRYRQHSASMTRNHELRRIYDSKLEAKERAEG